VRLEGVKSSWFLDMKYQACMFLTITYCCTLWVSSIYAAIDECCSSTVLTMQQYLCNIRDERSLTTVMCDQFTCFST